MFYTMFCLLGHLLSRYSVLSFVRLYHQTRFFQYSTQFFVFNCTIKDHLMRNVQGVDTAAWCPLGKSTFVRRASFVVVPFFFLCSLLHVFSVRSRFRHLPVVQLDACPVAKFSYMTTVCIVVDPLISFAIRCIVKLFPGILHDVHVQSIENSCYDMIFVQALL